MMTIIFGKHFSSENVQIGSSDPRGCLSVESQLFTDLLWTINKVGLSLLLMLLLYALSIIQKLIFEICLNPPQWGAADAEIKVPSRENTELKRSPFKARNRSVYSHTWYAYCQGFLSFLLISTLPVHSPAFFPNLSRFYPVLAVANIWFLCRPAE